MRVSQPPQPPHARPEKGGGSAAPEAAAQEATPGHAAPGGAARVGTAEFARHITRCRVTQGERVRSGSTSPRSRPTQHQRGYHAAPDTIPPSRSSGGVPLGVGNWITGRGDERTWLSPRQLRDDGPAQADEEPVAEAAERVKVQVRVGEHARLPRPLRHRAQRRRPVDGARVRVGGFHQNRDDKIQGANCRPDFPSVRHNASCGSRHGPRWITRWRRRRRPRRTRR